MGDLYTEFRTQVSRISINSQGSPTTIEISPGVAFGSSHATTRLCIRGMEEVFKERKIETVVDVGCGSGVLAVCAVALGADMVLALDFDAVAVKETKDNAWRNGVASKIHLLQGSLESVKGRFDLVMANITTSELLKMREELKNKLRGESLLLISGISEIKKDEAIYGFKEVGLSLKKEIFCEGWVGLIFALQSGD